MKPLKLLILGLFIISCRGEEESDIRKIDQVLKIFIQDASGKDLLDKTETGAFYSVEFMDLGALRDRVPVQTSLRQTVDSIYYREYSAGATRNLVSESDASKIFRSDMAVQYRDSVNAEPREDSMTVFYSLTPQVFQVSTVTYNGKTVFQKQDGKENIITIVK